MVLYPSVSPLLVSSDQFLLLVFPSAPQTLLTLSKHPGCVSLWGKQPCLLGDWKTPLAVVHLFSWLMLGGTGFWMHPAAPHPSSLSRALLLYLVCVRLHLTFYFSCASKKQWSLSSEACVNSPVCCCLQSSSDVTENPLCAFFFPPNCGF